jgi:predicted DNA-binding transcriptional regulator AlpA
MDSLKPLAPLPSHDETLIAAADLPRYVPVAQQTLARWRYEGRGPRFVKVGRRVAYRAGDIRHWLLERSFADTTASSQGLPKPNA